MKYSINKTVIIFNVLLSIIISDSLLYGQSKALKNNFKYVQIKLPENVTVNLPDNWTTWTEKETAALGKSTKEKTKNIGNVGVKSKLAFASNYYDSSKTTLAMFNIRYYPEYELTQYDISHAEEKDVQLIDYTLKSSIEKGLKAEGLEIIDWLGTNRVLINKATAIITEYKRSSIKGKSFCVRLIRYFNKEKSFVITISYRIDNTLTLRPICDEIINSIKPESIVSGNAE